MVAEGEPPQGGHGIYRESGRFGAAVPDGTGSVAPEAGGAVPAALPSKKTSKALLWGLVGGGVVAASIVLVLALGIPRSGGSGGSDSDGTAGAATAADVVKGYLTAVSQSDAKKAMTYLDQVSNKELLTDEVLKESNKLAPITGIRTKETKDQFGDAKVDATFSVGGKEVSVSYPVVRGKDSWTIVSATKALAMNRFKGLDVTANGVALGPKDSYEVFPGTYQLGLVSKDFAITGDSQFALFSHEDESAVLKVSIGLSDQGTATFRSLLRASLEACVAMTTLSTPCGLDITDINLPGTTPVDGSVTRTLTAEGNSALNSLAPKLSLTNPTVVSSSEPIRVSTSLSGSDGNTYDVIVGGRLHTPKVDFGQPNPRVVWE